MVVGALVLIVFLFYAYKRCRAILKLAAQQEHASQHAHTHVSSMAPAYPPPYVHIPNSSVHQPLQQYTSLLLSPTREPTTYPLAQPPPIVS
ncbi:unnamed protein product [Rotaria sp. Silwood2]|nr:unnamed protein product [Rotaria sp. Silwood2]CAF3268970.1 unnamed protein product [Rotaria sp. Silwood2]CAF4145115.1 unnamed protein product [Rotaria sp. Silwood2]CAF4395704.1 unnamed protein product [Rotaria sp. Silwood2]